MFPFDIASKQAQIQKYEEEINKQDFWDDNEKAQKILQQNSDLKNIIAEFEGLNSDLEEIERIILLQCVDNHWIDHIDAMDQLRQGIGLRALGQQDPVIAYKLEGFNMFDEMVDQIRQDTVRYLFGITIEKQPTERKQIVDVDTIEAPTDEPKQPVVKETKVGRNDLCPCGSGKKYKNCCGKN